eukprot:TRINITY_DN6056_c0_g2_i1.p1 TRINITY_DN6056_c0_g2~~TRINITY_DN6056_c0_g2_i1.p1  ORF type:complete len:1000 (-),score=203.81 TRINITY_DN6056_c0_g2_i1:123-2696(-)
MVAPVDQRVTAPVKRHVNEPRLIFPSVYISDVPVEYTEHTLRELHRKLCLNPDMITGVKFLPFTEVSLGGPPEGKVAAPVTGAVILRYQNEEAANAAVDRLRGHPIRTSSGVTKYLGARHAAPAKWMMERKCQEVETQAVSPVDSFQQKFRGVVVRVSAAGFGVIKNPELGEVMWRQYELPTNLRSLQVADPQKFRQEAKSRTEFRRLKEMEGREVEAELHKMQDGQVRASHVKLVSSSRFSSVPPHQQGPPPSRASQAFPLATETPVAAKAQRHPNGTVCVRPVPAQWSDAELWERFEWYGGLVEASVARRVRDDAATGVPPADGHPVWTLGVLRFDDVKCAEEVIRHETGGSLDGEGSVLVEAGQPIRPVGWVEGIVTTYLAEYGVGVLQSLQLNGEVHFEAPAETRTAGRDMRGLHVDAMVEYGGDGVAQAKEVRIKAEQPPPEATSPANEAGENRSRKRSSRRHGNEDAMQMQVQGMMALGMGMQGMQPWGGMLGGPSMAGMMGGPTDPYYKTQPCPYLRMNACTMGCGCYFAHSPEELRPAPEAMMMNHFIGMMGTGSKKEKKKDKKERKEKKERREDRDDDQSLERNRVSEKHDAREEDLEPGQGRSRSRRKQDCPEVRDLHERLDNLVADNHCGGDLSQKGRHFDHDCEQRRSRSRQPEDARALDRRSRSRASDDNEYSDGVHGSGYRRRPDSDPSRRQAQSPPHAQVRLRASSRSPSPPPWRRRQVDSRSPGRGGEGVWASCGSRLLPPPPPPPRPSWKGGGGGGENRCDRFSGDEGQYQSQRHGRGRGRGNCGHGHHDHRSRSPRRGSWGDGASGSASCGAGGSPDRGVWRQGHRSRHGRVQLDDADF